MIRTNKSRETKAAKLHSILPTISSLAQRPKNRQNSIGMLTRRIPMASNIKQSEQVFVFQSQTSSQLFSDQTNFFSNDHGTIKKHHSKPRQIKSPQNIDQKKKNNYSLHLINNNQNKDQKKILLEFPIGRKKQNLIIKQKQNNKKIIQDACMTCYPTQREYFGNISNLDQQKNLRNFKDNTNNIEKKSQSFSVLSMKNKLIVKQPEERQQAENQVIDDNQTAPIFVNRKANYIERRDVRTRVLKYMKDMEERNSSSKTQNKTVQMSKYANKYQKSDKQANSLKSKLQMTIRKNQRKDFQRQYGRDSMNKFEGWKISEDVYNQHQSSILLQSIINNEQIFY